MTEPTGVTGDQLLLMIGRKDVELEFTKSQVIALTQKVAQLTEELNTFKHHDKDAEK